MESAARSVYPAGNCIPHSTFPPVRHPHRSPTELLRVVADLVVCSSGQQYGRTPAKLGLFARRQTE